MKLNLYVVDAFTDTQFKGNSAAVVLVDDWLDVQLMQDIAAENNLSETAFVKREEANRFSIRWFSPLCEIDFCGHATLASSFVLFEEVGIEGVITFETLAVGQLSVTMNEHKRIEMVFPNRAPESVDEVPQALLAGLSLAPLEVYKNQQAYFAVYADEQSVQDVGYDCAELKKLAPLDVVVTGRGADYDCVSRYFWPANGGDEDPVTGSIHAGLAPFWAGRLGKNELVAHQASKRGGVLYCEVKGDKVVVSGDGVLYLKGEINV